MEISVFELRLKVYTLVDINLEEVLLAEAEYIDSAFALDDEWFRFHENNEYKNYTFSGLYPLAKDGIYKKDNVYTITIRTVDSRLEQYMRKTLANHYTDKMKGLTITSRIIPKKFISCIRLHRLSRNMMEVIGRRQYRLMNTRKGYLQMRLRNTMHLQGRR